MIKTKKMKLNEDELLDQNAPQASVVPATNTEVANAQADAVAPVDTASETPEVDTTNADAPVEAPTTDETVPTEAETFTAPLPGYVPSGWVNIKNLATAVAQETGDVEAAETAPDAQNATQDNTISSTPIDANASQEQPLVADTAFSIPEVDANQQTEQPVLESMDLSNDEKNMILEYRKYNSSKLNEETCTECPTDAPLEVAKEDEKAGFDNHSAGAPNVVDVEPATVVESNKKRSPRFKEYTRPTFYGIPKIYYIDHGEWSDPEIEFKGHVFNYFELEDTLYDEYKDMFPQKDEESENEYADAFENWVKENPDESYEILNNMIDSLPAEEIEESKKSEEGKIKESKEDIEEVPETEVPVVDVADESPIKDIEDENDVVDEVPIKDVEEDSATDDLISRIEDYLDSDDEDVSETAENAFEGTTDFLDSLFDDDIEEEEDATPIDDSNVDAELMDSDLSSTFEEDDTEESDEPMDESKEESNNKLTEDIKYPAGSEPYENQDNLVEAYKQESARKREALAAFRKSLHESKFNNALNQTTRLSEEKSNSDPNAWSNNKFEEHVEERNKLDYKELLKNGFLG